MTLDPCSMGGKCGMYVSFRFENAVLLFSKAGQLCVAYLITISYQ